jgi:hypothetical protein
MFKVTTIYSSQHAHILAIIIVALSITAPGVVIAHAAGNSQGGGGTGSFTGAGGVGADGIIQYGSTYMPGNGGGSGISGGAGGRGAGTGGGAGGLGGITGVNNGAGGNGSAAVNPGGSGGGGGGGATGLLVTTTSANSSSVTGGAGGAGGASSSIIGNNVYQGQGGGGGTGVIVNGSVVFTNTGTITGGTEGVGLDSMGAQNGVGVGLTNNGSVINVGTITGGGTSGYAYGIVIDSTSTHSSITNRQNGVITTPNYYAILNNGIITALTNDGTISTTADAIYNSGTITALTNNQIISANARAIDNYGVITTLTNAGTIQSTTDRYAISNSGTITNLINSGTISASRRAIDINNGATIATLTNTGTIISTDGSWALRNNGTLTTLNNLQGAANSALIYTVALPTNYNIIIRSTTNYGQLAVTSGTGSLAFGIDSNSTLTNNYTYNSVFTGLSSANFNAVTGSSTVSGTSYTWTLSNSSGSIWNLSVAGNSIGNITSPSSNLSALGTSFTTTFDGGKLVVDSTGASNGSNFTIKKNSSGAIDQGGNKTSHFSGVFADDVGAGGGTASKLTITNSGLGSGATNGVVTLSGVNTYTGGTKVEAGATLAVTNANAIGTGTLELVGTSTTSANFVTLSSMTISNAIKVEGDPTFTAAPGTTMTISSVIADGASAGDVVIGSSPGNAGGGTVALTAINTYSGNTTVDAGNTLVLSGNGSIAFSGTGAGATGVFNNGTFNIAPASSTIVQLGANYTQSSTGTLGMNWYQKLTMLGTASLAGTLSLFNSDSRSYSLGRYTLLTATGGRTGTFGTLNTANLSSGYSYSLSYDANDAYLTVAPSADYTQQSLVNTAQALQGTFALQNSILNSSLGYDCNLFGPNGVCISTGGRNTAVQAEGINNSSALLIAAYKVMPKVRIGAYADQNLSTQAPGTVKLGNNTPLLGMFAAWNENPDGTGLEVKASASYGQKTATVTRGVVVTSEPGSGSSNLTTQGAQFVTKYGFAVTPKTIVTPYAGLRYSQSNMAGYTEGASSTVTSPLTYQALNTNATTLLAGASATHALDPKTTVFASAGVESDTNTANGSYSATSANIAGLTPINFNPTAVNTRPTATVGAYYDLEKNQRLGIVGGYAQTPFKAVSTTSVMATYTIGL